MNQLKSLLFSTLLTGFNSAAFAGQPFVGLTEFVSFNEAFPFGDYLASL